MSDATEKRIAILERALKWYADPESWHPDNWNVKAVVCYPDYGDPGGKARRALKKSAALLATKTKGAKEQ